MGNNQHGKMIQDRRLCNTRLG
ncbi:MAG: hypothetical protein RLY14_1241, partial [Planctomycetota bacterium]